MYDFTETSLDKKMLIKSDNKNIEKRQEEAKRILVEIDVMSSKSKGDTPNFKKADDFTSNFLNFENLDRYRREKQSNSVHVSQTK